MAEANREYDRPVISDTVQQPGEARVTVDGINYSFAWDGECFSVKKENN